MISSLRQCSGIVIVTSPHIPDRVPIAAATKQVRGIDGTEYQRWLDTKSFLRLDPRNDAVCVSPIDCSRFFWPSAAIYLCVPLESWRRWNIISAEGRPDSVLPYGN